MTASAEVLEPFSLLLQSINHTVASGHDHIMRLLSPGAAACRMPPHLTAPNFGCRSVFHNYKATPPLIEHSRLISA